MNIDYEDSEEGNTLPASAADTADILRDLADILRDLAKEPAPTKTTFTFEGGSQRDREAAMKKAAADTDAIIAAHPKDSYQPLMEYTATRYDVINVQFVDGDNDDNYSVEITLATPLPPAPTAWRDREWARFPQTMAKNSAADKQPDLFDAVFVRSGKTTPITLSSVEFRVLFALAAFISRPEELKRDDVRRKILNPYAANQEVKRVIPIEFLARTIFDSNSQHYREVIRKALYTLATVVQYLDIDGDKWRRAPLIHLGKKSLDLDYSAVKVTFGSIFFVDLNDCYIPIHPPTLFAAWRKAGRGTELFARLLSLFIHIYIAKKRQETAIRKKIKQEAGDKATAADIERRTRAEVQRVKLQYTHLNVETIKRKIGRDYESKKQYAAAFWRDLDAAIEGLKEIGIITAASSTAATARPGTKRKERPRQIVFTINLDYDKAAAAVDTDAEEVAAAARADLLLDMPRNITATDDTTDDVAEEIRTTLPRKYNTSAAEKSI